jgi:KDO2-lipid IV(A) lauroyltransferase
MSDYNEAWPDPTGLVPALRYCPVPASIPSSLAILFARLAARLPLAWLQATGGLAGRLALWASPGFRRKTDDNLTAAGLPVQTLAAASAAQAGAAACETLWIWFSGDERLKTRIRCEHFELLERARAAGRGVILLTPHLGSFEAAARSMAFSEPITVLYKPPREAVGRSLIEAGRRRSTVHLAPASSAGVRALVRALRRGEAIGVLPDQVPSDGEGVWAPFFGRPAYTMTLPQRLAGLTGATVLLAYGERLPRGQGWTIRIEPFTEEPSPGQINRAMEDLIRRLPEQYFWGYNRYKVPPGVTRPVADQPGA